MADLYYTVEEVAKIFRVSTKTVRNWIKDGELRAIQIKRDYRIPVSAVEEIQRSGELEAALMSVSH